MQTRMMHCGAVASLLLCLPACKEEQRPTSAARSRVESLAGQTLRVYSFPNYFGRMTISSFEARTGSKVVVETYASNEEMIGSLEVGARHDVVFPSSYAVERLVGKGLLKAMERDRVSNLIQVPERFRNPPVDPGLRHCVPYTWSLTGIGVYAPREGRSRDPDSLKAIFGPEGGKVLMLDDMRATLGVALRYLGLPASTQDAAEVAQARDLLLAQAPRVLRYVSDAGPALRSGQAGAALAWSGDVLAMQRKSEDVRFVLPREGTLLYVDYACVPERSPNPALAFAFLNHLLEPQVAAEITNSQLWATPNTGAQKHLEPEAKWLWGILDAVKDQGRFEMLRDVGPAMPLYAQAWQEVKAKVESAAR